VIDDAGTTTTTQDATRAEASALWADSFQGEVLGEAYFARMGQLAADPEQKDKIDLLVRLERSTKEMLVPFLDRNGVPTEPNSAVVEAMGAIEAYDWTTMLEGVRPVAADFLTKYRRLAELVDAADSTATEALVAHELALDEFCRRELAGEPGSADAILALPHLN
jgi:hypothetical protein